MDVIWSIICASFGICKLKKVPSYYLQWVGAGVHLTENSRVTEEDGRGRRMKPESQNLKSERLRGQEIGVCGFPWIPLDPLRTL